MDKDAMQSSALESRLVGVNLAELWARCRPRILVVVDFLDYRATNSFGLSRFLAAITSGLAPKPVLTLAHRTFHAGGPVQIGSDSYTVINNFNFATAATPVRLTHYDQIWLFGYRDQAFSLSNAEVGVIAAFMNGGGGVFATGDHASIGRSLCGDLPRIRHMREWHDVLGGGVPMGRENNVNQAVRRHDTIVDPGANGLYDFEDQSDGIPQRIYPNYRVVDTDGLFGNRWAATVHPVLMLPGAAGRRTDNTGFRYDLDVLPDHAHESQCYEVTDRAVLAGAYALHGQNFREWNPAFPLGSPIRPEIVAYAVSGGRSVYLNSWKPPVRPRMFGAISAYDGRLAAPYPGQSQAPGRIVCESTWHHYVNINIDGTGAVGGRTGLGTGVGAGFVPGLALRKIYAYWRNLVRWLQPANRTWCGIFWPLAELRFEAALAEELLSPGELTSWSALVGLGREAQAVAELTHGRGYLRDALVGVLLTDPGFAAVRDELIATDPIVAASSETATARDGFVREELLDGLIGALLLQMAAILPDDVDPAETAKVLAAGPDKHAKALRDALERGITLGVDDQAARLERGRATVASLRGASRVS